VAYYAPAFRTGAYPAISDNLWLWSRPHPKAATPTAPTAPQPSGWSYTDDNLYAIAMLSAPANVTITSGANKGNWYLPAGVNKISLASAPGSIAGSIVRGTATVKAYNSTGTFTYTAYVT
jgi:glucan endo-1,3-alpha-glucosidase